VIYLLPVTVHYPTLSWSSKEQPLAKGSKWQNGE
jgi:hypothetical protein